MHRSPHRRWPIALALLAALVAWLLPSALRHVRALGLLLGVAGVSDPTGVVQWLAREVQEDVRAVQAGTRSLRARAYRPHVAGRASGVVLLHGVHPRGIDEPHLRSFARDLAATGLDVLTPELPELLDNRVEPSTVDDIAACAQRHARSTGDKVGVWGVSFAGGLALLAATRPDAGRTLSHVVAIGAHHDLARVARYYAGLDVRAPDGSRPTVRPHPYGARVILLAHAASIFSPEGLPGARRALRSYLAGRREAAHREAARLDPATRALVEMLLDDRHRDDVGRLLARAAEEHAAELARVSPVKQLRGLRVPTYLLHGTDDPVIPSLETMHLQREIPAAFLRLALVTPVLRHTEAGPRPPLAEYGKVVRFVAELLDAADVH